MNVLMAGLVVFVLTLLAWLFCVITAPYGEDT